MVPAILQVIDLVQARYGLTDEQVFQIPYARLLQKARLASQAERRRWELAARITFPWEAKEGETFAEYLRRLGLMPKPAPLTKEELEEEKRRALRVAEEITAMFQAGGGREITS